MACRYEKRDERRRRSRKYPKYEEVSGRYDYKQNNILLGVRCSGEGNS